MKPAISIVQVDGSGVAVTTAENVTEELRPSIPKKPEKIPLFATAM